MNTSVFRTFYSKDSKFWKMDPKLSRITNGSQISKEKDDEQEQQQRRKKNKKNEEERQKRRRTIVKHCLFMQDAGVRIKKFWSRLKVAKMTSFGDIPLFAPVISFLFMSFPQNWRQITFSLQIFKYASAERFCFIQTSGSKNLNFTFFDLNQFWAAKVQQEARFNNAKFSGTSVRAESAKKALKTVSFPPQGGVLMEDKVTVSSKKLLNFV